MKIIVFPLRENPYQGYLYKEVEKIVGSENIIYFKDFDTNSRVGFIKDIIAWPIKLSAISGHQKIFHIHWQFFYFLLNKRIRIIPSICLCIWSLLWVKILGYKIVWTVHDYEQHDIGSFLNRAIRKVLFLTTDKYIVLNKATLKILVDNDGIPSKKTSLIPIGNYGSDTTYHPIENNKSIRLLFFGLVRKYKGVERLIEVFKKIDDKNIRLEIAGDCYTNSYFESLKKIAGDDIRIKIQNIFVDEAELSKKIHGCNVVVLPFLEVTNSSSAIMAYSKGRPVIAPKIGSFIDQPKNIGVLYYPNTDDELKRAILRCISMGPNLERFGQNALNHAKTLNWEYIATNTVAFYEQLVNNRS